MKKLAQFSATTILVGSMVAITGFSSTSGASTTGWSWRVAGTLSRHPVCSAKSSPGAQEQCSFKVPNAAKPNGIVTGVVEVRNLNAHTRCFGVSISTSYMAGLNQFCVKAGATGEFRTKGPAHHYIATRLILFVTSGSTNKPIQPMNDSGTYGFVITFSEPR